MKGHQYRWLADGYNQANRTLLDVASVDSVTWWIVAFLHSDCHYALLFKMDLNGGKEESEEEQRHKGCLNAT